MGILLLRDTDIYLSTVDIESVSPTAANTTKLSVLGDFTIAQSSVIENYSTFRMSETPNRVDVRYVKDFNLVELNFNTYVKTKQVSGLAEPADLLLWKALTNNGITKTSSSCTISFTSSKTNIFPDLYIYLSIDGEAFKVGKCYISSVTIDFDINGIAKTAWKVSGLAYTKIANPPSVYLDRTETTGYIKGKLSKLDFTRSMPYNLPLLGGQVTIEQKVTRLSTPIVAEQIATNPRVKIENRTVTAKFSTYLRTGAGRSLDLLSSMLNSLATVNNTSTITMHLGDTAEKHLSVSMPKCIINLPSINVKDVYTTDIDVYPLESSMGTNDDITIIYYN